MSRNGYEMDDEKRDAGSTSDVVDAPQESTETAPKPRPRKSRAPKAAAAKAPKGEGAPAPKKAAARKSVAPRSRRTTRPPKAETSEAIVIPKITAVVSEPVNPDLISIPPADLDEHDERFFAEGEAQSQRGEHLPSVRMKVAGQARSSDVAERPLAPVVRPEHRQKLANYVKVTVAVSAALCLFAAARVGFGRVDHGPVKSAAAAPIAREAPVAHVAPPPAAEPVKAAEPAPPAVPLKSATEEREDARTALEHGKAKEAVEAATRSITVDPTDAEAWLLLGAAQQETGKGADAHASFLECTKQAKTGNVNECRAMLTWNGPR